MTAAAPEQPASVGAGPVQSIERAFRILDAMADAGGTTGLSELAGAVDLPLPTIHRLVRTLVGLGYVRQEPSRKYALGVRLVRLGEVSAATIGTWALPYLTDLVEATGESVSLAMLEGAQVVYVGQVQSRQSMRMFNEVGRRVTAHSTATGKAVLSLLDDEEVLALVRHQGLLAHTPRTITDPDELVAALAVVRAQGFAVDDGEHEVGVRCVAVTVPGMPSRTALSVSGPTQRMTDEAVTRWVPLLHETAARLSGHLVAGSGTSR